MNMKVVYIFGMLLAVSACSDAQKAAEVNPSFVSTTKYANLSCSALRAEAERVATTQQQLEADVDKAYKRDKGVEVATWLLFWPAAIAMKGNDAEANQLAQAKGEVEAVKAAMLSKGCKP